MLHSTWFQIEMGPGRIQSPRRLQLRHGAGVPDPQERSVMTKYSKVHGLCSTTCQLQYLGPHGNDGAAQHHTSHASETACMQYYTPYTPGVFYLDRHSGIVRGVNTATRASHKQHRPARP